MVPLNSESYTVDPQKGRHGRTDVRRDGLRLLPSDSKCKVASRGKPLAELNPEIDTAVWHARPERIAAVRPE